MSIYKGVIKLYISIHASAKEATAQNGGRQAAYEISIHASAKEATIFACLR